MLRVGCLHLDRMCRIRRLETGVSLCLRRLEQLGESDDHSGVTYIKEAHRLRLLSRGDDHAQMRGLKRSLRVALL